MPFVTETVDLQHKSEAFLAKYEEANPGGRAKVPIVEIDGLVLTESAVVVEYLAEKDGPGPFYLEDPARRAAARLMAEVHPFGDYFKFLKLRDDPEALAAAVADLTGKLEVFEAFLVKHGDAVGPFFNGEDLCFAEANLAPFLQRMVPTLKHLSLIHI